MEDRGRRIFLSLSIKIQLHACSHCAMGRLAGKTTGYKKEKKKKKKTAKAERLDLRLRVAEGQDRERERHTEKRAITYNVYVVEPCLQYLKRR